MKLSIATSFVFAVVCQAAVVPSQVNNAKRDTQAPGEGAANIIEPLPIFVEHDQANFRGSKMPPPPQQIAWRAEDLRGMAGNQTQIPPSANLAAAARALRDKRNILGPDDRWLYTGTDYPFLAMGRLLMTNGAVCSGALIGPRHVMAARHCLLPDVGYEFQPLYYNGGRFQAGWAEIAVYLDGSITSSCDYKDDWLILVIDQRLGESHGWLGATINPGLYNQNIMWNFGYPGDKGASTPWVQNGFAVNELGPCANGGPLQSFTADAMGGQSGGPVWVEADGPYQVGVLVAGSAVVTLMAHGGAWFDAIVWSTNTWT